MMKSKPGHVIDSLEFSVTDSLMGMGECSCKKKNVKLSDAEKIGEFVTKMLEGKPYGKAVIKLEIDFQ